MPKSILSHKFYVALRSSLFFFFLFYSFSFDILTPIGCILYPPVSRPRQHFQFLASPQPTTQPQLLASPFSNHLFLFVLSLFFFFYLFNLWMGIDDVFIKSKAFFKKKCLIIIDCIALFNFFLLLFYISYFICTHQQLLKIGQILLDTLAFQKIKIYYFDFNFCFI